MKTSAGIHWNLFSFSMVGLMLLGLLAACGNEFGQEFPDGSQIDADGAGENDAGSDAGSDADLDAGSDAGSDAESDAESDAGSDGWSDAGSDAGTDAGADAGSDAAGGDDGSSPYIDTSFFFGYFSYDNYLWEMEGHTNVVLGFSHFEFLQEAKERGMKPIVWLATILQLWDFGEHSSYLKSNYLEIWNDYAQYLAPYIDDIYGFYPADEPFWAAQISAEDQNTLNLAIKASFPDKPILTTFARPTIEASGFIVPSTYDYVGYDNYYGSSFESDRTYYEVLKSKLSPGQKIFLIGDAFAASTSITQAGQELKASKIYLAYELATTPGEPVVGILSYVWDSFSVNWPGTGPPYYLGLRDMPFAKPSFIAVGQTVLAGASTGPVPTGTVVVDTPTVSATQISLVWQAVDRATDYVVLWSSALGDSSMVVTTTWAVIDTDTSYDHWISIYPCNEHGCGDPTYLGPI
ncbi:MAG: hypothetical protein JRF33_08950 [Deltaproteobacteria bacterium]|nr:hypothetical protein [Deltaproteobacteria bacterium]